MGMDIYANNGNYFRANIWSWRAILYVLEKTGFDTPPEWGCNDGAGFSDQASCNKLADRITDFLATSDTNIFTMPTNAVAVNDKGAFVDVGTPNSHSPYQTDREHLQEFADFLYNCGGFQIC